MSEFLYNFAFSAMLLTPVFAVMVFVGLLEVPWRVRTKYIVILSIAAGSTAALFVSLIMLLTPEG